MAGSTDAQVKTKFEEHRAGFDLLSLSRGDLASRIPKSAGSEGLAMNPAVYAIQDLLTQLDMIKI